VPRHRNFLAGASKSTPPEPRRPNHDHETPASGIRKGRGLAFQRGHRVTRRAGASRKPWQASPARVPGAETSRHVHKRAAQLDIVLAASGEQPSRYTIDQSAP
jgi:hypothetical protein